MTKAVAALRCAALRGVVGGGKSVPAVDAGRTLERLAKEGLRLGVVSNSNGTLQERLEAGAICALGGGGLPAAEFILDSGVVGIDKPDLRIFEWPSTILAYLRTAASSSATPSAMTSSLRKP